MSFINLEKKTRGKVCRSCGKDGLKWIPSVDTRSGVELADFSGQVHKCGNKYINDIMSQWVHFFKFGYPNAVAIEKDHQHEMNIIPPELKKKYAEENERWKKHDAFALDGQCPCGCRKIPKTFKKRK